MNKVNYSLETEKILRAVEAEGRKPSLLLHSCCAPCSSYCMEYLRTHFRITVFYYNPNITETGEYEKRKAEEMRLIAAYNREAESLRADSSLKDMEKPENISVLEAPYDPDRFLSAVRGLEDCPEGGERCFRCYALRLGRTAEAARDGGFDYFATTLTISPLKNAQKLNEIASLMGSRYGVKPLPSDFKKKGGYQRSIELSRQYGLYRQNYCGCVFSRRPDAVPSEV